MKKTKKSVIDKVFDTVSKKVKTRDEFLKAHKKVLLKYQELEAELEIVRLWAREKIDIAIEAKEVSENVKFEKSDDYIEFRVNKDLHQDNLTVDIFEKVRYNTSNNKNLHEKQRPARKSLQDHKGKRAKQQ